MGAANHRAMSEPEHAAAEPLPAGTQCFRCQYDVVGRVPGEPCPECGLDVAASWPVEDLRRCHRAYVEQVHQELDALHSICAMVILLCLALGVASGLLGWPWGRAHAEMVLLGSLMVAVILGGGVIRLFFQFFILARMHPKAPHALSNRRRRTIIEAGCIVAGAGISLITLAIPATAVARGLGLIIALLCVLVAGVALLVAYTSALAYAKEALNRAGVTAKRTLLEEAPGLLPFVAIGAIPIAVLGIMPGWWLLTAAALGVALAAGGLALRCARARRVLGRLIDEPA